MSKIKLFTLDLLVGLSISIVMVSILRIIISWPGLNYWEHLGIVFFCSAICRYIFIQDWRKW